jgi:hypothetical protein
MVLKGASGTRRPLGPAALSRYPGRAPGATKQYIFPETEFKAASKHYPLAPGVAPVPEPGPGPDRGRQKAAVNQAARNNPRKSRPTSRRLAVRLWRND